MFVFLYFLMCSAETGAVAPVSVSVRVAAVFS